MALSGSPLCLTCGLCCNGTLYERVEVKPQHVPLVSKLRLRLEPFNDSFQFPQPCSLYQKDCCSVYPHHPPSCKAYKCALLHKYESGEVTFDESIAIVQETKEFTRGDSWETIRQDMAQGWNVEQGVLESGAARTTNVAAVLRAVTVDRLLEKHFRWPKKDEISN